MPEDKKSQPTLLVVILMLLGLFAVPKGAAPDNSAMKTAVTKSAVSEEGGQEPEGSGYATKKSANPDATVLGPAFDLSDDGSVPRIEDRTDVPGFSALGRRKLVQELVDRVHRRGGTVQAMIALVPDPVRTSVSEDYDSQNEGIQRAAEAVGFVLARTRFPWQEMRKADKSRDNTQNDKPDCVAADRRSATQQVIAAAQSASAGSTNTLPGLDDQPGLLVFRHSSEKLLLVFLVRETPTFGLKKHQLNWSLHLLDSFADAEAAWPTVENRQLFCILGPRYTGTQTSLNQVIDGWLTQRPSDLLPGERQVRPIFRRSYRFSIAACATEIEVSRLKKLRMADALALSPPWMTLELLHAAVPPKQAEIKYFSGLNRRVDITKAMIRFLNQQSGNRKRGIALLVESNTALGRTISRFGLESEQRKKVDPGSRDRGDADIEGTYINVYHYPLHIGSLRASYEKQGLLRDPAGQVFRSPGRLELPPEESDRRRDIVTAETPEFSTRVDELVMVQTMTDITRGISSGRYGAVGVAGSSSRDVIFLAQLVRKYSPDALLFSSSADLLFTQPQTIADLRGMLVGSSYPLYAPNRLWCYPYGAGPDVYFKDDGFQAMYNAAMSLFADIYKNDVEDDRHKLKSLAYPLELGLPFAAEQEHPRPAIWISVVGNRGIYPICAAQAPTRSSEFDSSVTPPKVMNKQGKPTQKSNVDRFRFYPSYHAFWQMIEGFLLLLGMILLGLALLEVWWVLAKIHRSDLAAWKIWKFFEWPACFLVWSRAWNSAKDAPASVRPLSSSGHGPGPLLVIVHAVFFLVYLSLNWPFVALSWPFARPMAVESGLTPELGWWRWVAIVGLVVAFVSLSLSTTAWLRLSFENRSPVAPALTAAAVLCAGIFALNRRAIVGDDDALANFLALERIVTVTSGVSPTFPMIFLGIGAACLVVAQLKRRYLSEQFSIKNLAPDRKRRARRLASSSDPLTHVEEKIDELAGVFRQPTRVFRFADCAALLPVVLYLGLILKLCHAQWTTGGLGEGAIFNAVFWNLFGLLTVILAFHVYLVHVIWSRMKQLLALVSRLPLSRAFDRIPPRVERWFFEFPSPRNRSMMIETQATALAERSEASPVRSVLQKMFSPAISTKKWESLPDQLRKIYAPEPTPRALHTRSEAHRSLPCVRRFHEDQSEISTITGAIAAPHSAQVAVATWRRLDAPGQEHRSDPGPNEFLKQILIRFWHGLPLNWTYANTNSSDSGAAKAASNWPISPSNLQSLIGRAEPGKDDLMARIREWMEIAEDLIALQLLRHLSQFVAQLRTMVGFIVIGSFVLLLAINSYPFPLQDRTEFVLTILIAVAAAVILRVIVGINRDETISRVAGTGSGLKLDRNLLGALIGYILPLVGILAAVSYDVSDLLRVWLDPVFRLLM